MRVMALGAALAAGSGCLLGWNGTAPKECESSTCGCYETKNLTFTGFVMDGVTHECVAFKLVRLRDLDGTVKSEDTSKSFGGYQVQGDVQRSPNCGGGEPVIRDEPAAGQTFPEFAYLPISSPIDDVSIKTNLYRFPFGSVDAGTGHPETCLPPRRDGGTGDGG